MRDKFWYTLKRSWLLWPAANAINFGMVPLKFQVLYFNFISMFWNMFLSYAQNVYKPETAKAPAVAPAAKIQAIVPPVKSDPVAKTVAAPRT